MGWGAWGVGQGRAGWGHGLAWTAAQVEYMIFVVVKACYLCGAVQRGTAVGHAVRLWVGAV